jgi:hypothetical protein
MVHSSSWLFWALLSAVFAALTAIFAKVGIENVNSDFATFIRTIVILLTAGGIMVATAHWQAPSTVSAGPFRTGHRRVVGLLLPGAEARQRRPGSPNRQAQRCSGGGVRRDNPRRANGSPQLVRNRADRGWGNPGGDVTGDGVDVGLALLRTDIKNDNPTIVAAHADLVSNIDLLSVGISHNAPLLHFAGPMQSPTIGDPPIVAPVENLLSSAARPFLVVPAIDELAADRRQVAFVCVVPLQCQVKDVPRIIDGKHLFGK